MLGNAEGHYIRHTLLFHARTINLINLRILAHSSDIQTGVSTYGRPFPQSDIQRRHIYQRLMNIRQVMPPKARKVVSGPKQSAIATPVQAPALPAPPPSTPITPLEATRGSKYAFLNKRPVTPAALPTKSASPIVIEVSEWHALYIFGSTADCRMSRM